MNTLMFWLDGTGLVAMVALLLGALFGRERHQ